MASTLTSEDAGAPLHPSSPAGATDLHRNPPFTPVTLVGSASAAMLVLGVVTVLATAAAAYNDAQILDLWDEPIQRFVEDHRPEQLTNVLELLTLLGHQNAILPATALFMVIAWRRCRIVSFLLVGLTVARIVIHLALKDGVARDRPRLEPLVDAVGNSYASGHVISAVLIWGLVPFIVGLLTPRRGLWYATVALAVLVMASSTVSRFYLGVHWFTDAVIGLIIGLLLLIATDVMIRRDHRGQAVVPGPLGRTLHRWAAPGSCRSCSSEYESLCGRSRGSSATGASHVDARPG